MTDTLIQTIAKAFMASDALTYDEEAENVIRVLGLHGYAIVPREPSRQMIDAAYSAHDAYEAAEPPAAWCGVSSIYRAMIAAITTGERNG